MRSIIGFLPADKRIAKGMFALKVTVCSRPCVPVLAQRDVSPQSYGVFPPCVPALTQRDVCPLSHQSIAIHGVPAPWAPEVSLFTVFPHPGPPKYCYLQCSRPCPGDPGQVTQDRWHRTGDPRLVTQSFTFWVDAGIILWQTNRWCQNLMCVNMVG